MSFDFDQLNAAIAAHGSVVRVVIVDIKGSSPREVGASMVVWDGGQQGSIGGGALEFEAAAAARAGQLGVSTHALGPDLGQCCGGAVTLVTEGFDAPLSPAPSFARNIGGADDIPGIVAKFQTDIAQGNALGKLLYRKGWLVEAAQDPKARPVWVWGAGHVGREVVDILGQLPHLRVTWLDYAPDRFPDTAKGHFTARLYDPVDQTAADAPQDAQHLILTHSHEVDLAICHALLARGFASCGLIGSSTKWARFRKRLIALGHAADRVDRIACPIGDKSFGKHPAAIAVSVAHAVLSGQESHGGRLGGDTA